MYLFSIRCDYLSGKRVVKVKLIVICTINYKRKKDCCCNSSGPRPSITIHISCGIRKDEKSVNWDRKWRDYVFHISRPSTFSLDISSSKRVFIGERVGLGPLS